jgi:hypothetical protein
VEGESRCLKGEVAISNSGKGVYEPKGGVRAEIKDEQRHNETSFLRPRSVELGAGPSLR